jgi:hypothetical protein
LNHEKKFTVLFTGNRGSFYRDYRFRIAFVRKGGGRPFIRQQKFQKRTFTGEIFQQTGTDTKPESEREHA